MGRRPNGSTCWKATPLKPAANGAGCFVLLTNLSDQVAQWPAPELLALAESLTGSEKNNRFRQGSR